MSELTDVDFRYDKELSRRETPEARAALIAQEVAYVQPNLVFADLHVFLHEGVFPKELENDEDIFDGRDFTLEVGMFGVRRRRVELLERTDDSKVEQVMNRVLEENPEILKKVGVKNIGDLNPAQAALVSLEITKLTLRYNQQMKGSRDIALRKATDLKTVDELIGDGSTNDGGVCEHQALVTAKYYEILKKKSGGKLNNSFLGIVDTSLAGDEGAKNHAWNVLVARNKNFDTVVSAIDPTHYASRDHLAYVSSRRVSSTILALKAWGIEKIGVSNNELVGIISERLHRIAEKEITVRSQYGYSPSVNAINEYFSAKYTLGVLEEKELELSQYLIEVYTDFASRINDREKGKFITDIISSNHILGTWPHSLGLVNLLLTEAIKTDLKETTDRRVFIKELEKIRKKVDDKPAGDRNRLETGFLMLYSKFHKVALRT